MKDQDIFLHHLSSFPILKFDIIQRWENLYFRQLMPKNNIEHRCNALENYHYTFRMKTCFKLLITFSDRQYLQ